MLHSNTTSRAFLPTLSSQSPTGRQNAGFLDRFDPSSKRREKLARIRRLTNRLNVLFVCSRNQWRSPTAEAVYRDDPRVSVRSRGTTRSARQTIQAVDLAWADMVLGMEDKHRHRLLADYPGETKFLPIQVLHIPDDYQFMDPELVELICVTTEPLIDSIQSKQLPEP